MENTIKVTTETQYVAAQSQPDDDRYVFAYTITIENTGEKTAKLINRHWLITDSNGKKNEVHGSGVIGQQPVIEPGDSFQYTSGSVVETPVATMQGHYEMQTEDGSSFEAPIDVFRLAVPNILN
ncbi:Co2+/Mg2+ efflux protein ApaG [Catenovulum sp. SM1970]|uniref:Co2+/Mg2+ efflux protein ApaG n=1 Tax=Marinifaba aquimaris TaxID=2741323 RepID=UPI00157445A4|nr:Co2+/Mg2+ efflux protein ApaG [Marinifaba aquimaris]NTS77450.1 Co2+/Mg2+ efflux protein ApaG [Marinifaba aquimaris]